MESDPHNKEEEEEEYESSEEETPDATKLQRLEFIQQMFAALQRDKGEVIPSLQNYHVELVEKLKSSDFEQVKKALKYFDTYASDDDNLSQLASDDILSAVLSFIKDIDMSNNLEVVSDPVLLSFRGLSRIAEPEIYTKKLVELNFVPSIIRFILDSPKCLNRKYATKTLYHICESAFLRDKIPEVLKSQFPERIQEFVAKANDTFDKNEFFHWTELLQNTDLVLYQYKPGKPFYDPILFECTKLLEANFEKIKAEALTITEQKMVPWPEKFLYKDGWNVLGMFAFQNKLAPSNVAPVTTSLLEQIPGLQTALFSTLKPRCHIKPHVGYYSYSEKILRVHMGIVVPKGCVIKVNGEERTWEEGKCIVFDDTFRHEVWNPSYDTTRIVLMLDIAFQGNVEDRNQEFYEKSRKQQEAFGTDALISRDLIDAITSFGASENNHFKERPAKYV
eukprot:TRINITY_DN3865_c3_g1_i1.p1 TRINITY_DN3865_c3_g1~~TRINITY_DN3865_c3_g1_i1.p1  ORF type:complete len:449 (-),score=108.13 TRINITY_DN3865_c3_g1_i1:112-1458(-)